MLRSVPAASGVRAREAEVRRARAAYFPTLSLVGDLSSILGQARITGGNKSTGWFGAAEPSYGVGLFIEWNIFEGGATRRRVELAEAERRAAEDEVTAARDRAVSEVWKAYTDVHLAVRRLDVAAALVTASEQSYESILDPDESFRVGASAVATVRGTLRRADR